MHHPISAFCRHSQAFLTLALATATLFFVACGGAGLNPHAVRRNQAAVHELGLGEVERAEANLRVAIELDPTYAEARANLAIVLMRKDLLVEAEQEARTAVALRDALPHAWNVLAQILEATARVPAARQAYEHALSVDPEFLDARVQLAMLLLRAEEHAAAVAHLRRAATGRREGAWMARAFLALVLALDGEFAEAQVEADGTLVGLARMAAAASEEQDDGQNNPTMLRLERMMQSLTGRAARPPSRAHEAAPPRLSADATALAHATLGICQAAYGNMNAAREHLGHAEALPSLQTLVASVRTMLDASAGREAPPQAGSAHAGSAQATSARPRSRRSLGSD